MNPPALTGYLCEACFAAPAMAFVPARGVGRRVSVRRVGGSRRLCRECENLGSSTLLVKLRPVAPRCAIRSCYK